MMFAKLVDEIQPEKRRTQRQSSKPQGAISATVSSGLNKAVKSQIVNNTPNESVALSASSQRRRGSRSASNVQRNNTTNSKSSRRTRTSQKDGGASALRRTNHSRKNHENDLIALVNEQ